MTMRRGNDHPDELISAAISGDLTDDEQVRLDAHLATCETCRQTMAAWTDQRRLVSELRQPPVPRDLGPRIRAGIESGAFAVPWWRRNGLLVGVGASLATVAAAVLAVVVISDLLPGPPVARVAPPARRR
jgi:anti-sigma factor RsiW